MPFSSSASATPAGDSTQIQSAVQMRTDHWKHAPRRGGSALLRGYGRVRRPVTVLALCYETPLLRYAMRHLCEAARDCVGACGLLASCVLAPGLVHAQVGACEW